LIFCCVIFLPQFFWGVEPRNRALEDVAAATA
jgi:hypothetical protein